MNNESPEVERILDGLLTNAGLTRVALSEAVSLRAAGHGHRLVAVIGSALGSFSELRVLAPSDCSQAQGDATSVAGAELACRVTSVAMAVLRGTADRMRRAAALEGTLPRGGPSGSA